jgi:peptidyl-prolyl cis-trans isomerase C
VKYSKYLMLYLLACLLNASALAGEYVIEDQGVGMSLQELTELVKYWTPEMQQAAVTDRGDRIELLNMSLANKKIAQEAAKVTREANPELYWANQFRIRNVERQFVVTNFMNAIEVPDLSDLARERYLTEKNKYATIPQERLSSHILVLCKTPECDREAKRPEVEAILAELQSGAVFEDLVIKYSQDPGSKDKGGKFDRWLIKGTHGNVSPQYHQGVFEIDKVGDYSPLVESSFGFHIIRLDEIKEKSYQPYEDVRRAIILDLYKEYRSLAAKEFDARYRLSDEALIDDAVLDELLSQFKADDSNEIDDPNEAADPNETADPNEP